MTPICPVCNMGHNYVWGVRDEHAIHRCICCDAFFFDRALIIEEANDYQGYYDYLPDWDIKRFRKELDMRRRSTRAKLHWAVKYAGAGRVLLDIGAGPGFVCAAANELGWTSIGVEISKNAVEAGRKQYGVEYRELDDIPANSADVIVLSHVLEHLMWPQSMLSRALTKLKKDGVVYVQVPNFQSFFSIINTVRRRALGRGDVDCAMYVPDHLTGFNQTSLVKCFELLGFAHVAIRPMAQWGSTYDPFFLEFLIEQRKWSGIAKKLLIGLCNNFGRLSGTGDWIDAIFKRVDV